MKFEVAGIKKTIRLDVFLAGKTGLSRNYVQRLIGEGRVVLSPPRKIKKDLKLREGDAVRVILPPPCTSAVQPEDIPLDVIYEDDDVLVLNKKAGMVVHPGSKVLTGTLVNALLFRFGSSFNVGSVQRPGIVHRLDRDTSGIMIVAKTDLAYSSLARQFRERKIWKKYLALVKGRVKEGTEIETFFGRHPRLRQKMSVWTGMHSSIRRASTQVRILRNFGACTLLEVFPRTGRTHQIRVHLSYIGHPVMGDRVYGGSQSLSIDGSEIFFRRQMLHALSIRFTHPRTGRQMEFSAPVPEDMQKALDALGHLAGQ